MFRQQNARRGYSRPGFTLVELLVVIAIIGILIGLLFPAVQAAREAARRMSCKNNLKQLGLGNLHYCDAHKYFLPGQFRRSKDVGNSEIYSWAAKILPYIEQSAIYDRIDFNYPMTSVVNKGTSFSPGPTTFVISTFLCPSATTLHPTRGRDGRIHPIEGESLDDEMDGLAAIDYLALAGPHRKAPIRPGGPPYGRNMGVFNTFKDNAGIKIPLPKITPALITDGLSNTLAITESSGNGWWEEGRAALVQGKNIGTVGKDGIKDKGNPVCAVNMPAELAWEHEEPFSDHPGGVNAVMCDGSVHFLSQSMDIYVLRALASRNGGETLSGGI